MKFCFCFLPPFCLPPPSLFFFSFPFFLDFIIFFFSVLYSLIFSWEDAPKQSLFLTNGSGHIILIFVYLAQFLTCVSCWGDTCFYWIMTSKQRNRKINNLFKAMQLSKNYSVNSEAFWLLISWENVFTFQSNERWSCSKRYLECPFKFWLSFRPPPPIMTDDEDLDYTHFTNQQSSTRHFSKSESSHKGKKSMYGQV